MAGSRSAPVTVHACAKLNLALRVLGVRDDGYHSLRTVFQTVALHDTLTFRSAGPFQIESNDPKCPTDRSNLVWRAAEGVWRAAGRRGRPEGVHVRIVKRIPVQSGLGGGSSDAAAAIRGLAALWGVRLAAGQLHRLAADLGADVPFFLDGGTALGLDRGDLLFPLIDQPPAWVTLAIPTLGVRTQDAYDWWDRAHVGAIAPGSRRGARDRPSAAYAGHVARLPSVDMRNDLQPVVAARHPDIERLVRSLLRSGARGAAMSGSGSAVFGLFATRQAAAAASRALERRGVRVLVTRTLNRAGYQRLASPR